MKYLAILPISYGHESNFIYNCTAVWVAAVDRIIMLRKLRSRFLSITIVIYARMCRLCDLLTGADKFVRSCHCLMDQ